MTDNTINFRKKSLKVLYKCKTDGGYVLDADGKAYRFETYAEILDYFEKQGFGFFMHYSKPIPELAKTVRIMRRR